MRLKGALTFAEVRVMVAPPVFWMEMDWVAEVVETASAPKVRDAGWRETAPAARPVAVRGTSICPPAMLAAMRSEAVREPACWGTKLTLMVQVVLVLKLSPAQVSVSRKSVGLTPVKLRVETEREAVPVALRVMVWVALVCPTVRLAKVRLVGETVAVVAAAEAVARAICQTPRPYVPAVRAWAETVDEGTTSWVTGERGRPEP